jgi:hypothetical protein
MAQNANKNTQPTPQSHWLFWAWVSVVIGMLALGIAKGPNTKNFWLWWEGGALITSTVYTCILYVGFFTRSDENNQRIFKGIESWIALVPILCLSALSCLTMATIVTFATSLEAWISFTDAMSVLCLGGDKHLLPLIFLFLSGCCFCAIDLVFATKHTSSKIQREFSREFFFNGLPVTFAFFLLAVFVFRFDGSEIWHMSLKSFIGGAVAFEMLLSNTTFAIVFWNPTKL